MNIHWQEFLQSLEHLTGFVIVMIALGGLWGLTALMAKLVAIFVKPKVSTRGHAPVHAHGHGQAHVPAGAAPVVAAATTHPGPVEDDLVIVAAAVATMLGTRHRVVAVKPVSSSWGQQGRRDIHASHRIR
jgi:hypothetical protein